MRVLVMMSGGVDSSVAAALLRDEGHDVVGVTLKLWGGESDSGCCSISDVDDARRVADRLGLDHHTFGLGDEFTRHVVDPYTADHARGLTPNPCIECNRHLKFEAVDVRARQLGFDAVATGHHARIVTTAAGELRVARGADPAKDQSYVVHMLDQERLARTMFPIGHLHKSQVRSRAVELGLRTADKPDSQDVCFITRTQGRGRFLEERIEFTPARVVDTSGRELGRVPAVEMVTLGQRRGLGLPGGGAPRYVVDVDRQGVESVVTVGAAADLMVAEQSVTNWRVTGTHDGTLPGGELLVQTSAHGEAHPAEVVTDPADPHKATVRWAQPHRRVAPGQSVVAYQGEQVVAGGLATA